MTPCHHWCLLLSRRLETSMCTASSNAEVLPTPLPTAFLPICVTLSDSFKWLHCLHKSGPDLNIRSRSPVVNRGRVPCPSFHDDTFIRIVTLTFAARLPDYHVFLHLGPCNGLVGVLARVHRGVAILLHLKARLTSIASSTGSSRRRRALYVPRKSNMLQPQAFLSICSILSPVRSKRIKGQTSEARA